MFRLPVGPTSSIIRSLFIVFLILPALTLPGQTLNFRNYSVDDGLPFVQVFTIYQDNKGNLWSGGYGGLSSFNGISFENFSPRNGLPTHWVTSITSDNSGDLWVGTIEGVARYHNGIFETFTSTDGLSDNYVNCLLKDDQNILWLGTSKGLSRYDGKTFSAVRNSPVDTIPVTCFYQEPKSSRLWIGTENGIYSLQDGKFTAFPWPPFFDKKITAITRDREGRILAGTSDGIFRLENDHFNLLITPSGYEMPAVKAMISDNDGIVWIGAGNGLFSFDGKNFRKYLVAADNNSNKVVSLFIDYENSLWLGTHSGLYRFRGEGFVSFGPEEGLASNFVFGITEDQKGNIWACSEANGIYKYDGKTFTQIDRSRGLASSKANACVTMPNGEIFVGTDRGLSVISPDGSIRNYHRRDGLHSDTVNVIITDRQGRIWLGGGKGVTKFESGVFTPYYIHLKKNIAFDVWTMLEDSRGLFWVGTYTGGLFTFDGKNFADATERVGVDVDSYFGISEDNYGHIYFGTLDGVFIYKGKVIDTILQRDGLNSELVYCQLIDKNSQYIWIGTNQGLNRFDADHYARTKEKSIYAFGKEEGFTGVESNTNGAFIARDGTIWFGTVNGLIKFSPSEFRRNHAYTKTNITGFRLFYNDTTLPPDALLPYFENNISFEYVGICLTNPAKVRYKYMLEGFEDKWSPPTAERVARYSNLPPGTFTFKVISSNNEGLWNNQPAEYSFTIETPVWKRPWFWLLIAASAVVLLSASVFLRIHQIKKRERIQTEAQVAMARNELKALRAQMNPHFVFNSLNSIQHFILTNKTADAGRYLNKFARLMRVILNNSEKSQITVSEELEYLRLYLELEEMRFENKFTWHITVDEDVDADFIEIPAMLLQPYIENSILHGLTPRKEKGSLDVTVRLDGNTLVCSVIDNGIGRDKARELRQLSTRKDHLSLGMKITHDRLELINRLHGSQLSVAITDLFDEQHHAAGTRVDIFIPVT